jgi:hypothetical protein
MLEEQALDRVHRIGQNRDVVTIRYIVKDSIEIVRPFYLYFSCSIEAHALVIQYVQEVQQLKLRLVEQCLGDVASTQAAVDEKRWKVSTF